MIASEHKTGRPRTAMASPRLPEGYTSSILTTEATVCLRLQVLETARSAFESSNQKVSMTNLSGRRDMSLLLALSACQVRCLHLCECD